MGNDYIVVTWPDVQELMEVEGFREHSYPINDTRGIEDFGSNAYFVDKTWYFNYWSSIN